MMKEKKKKLSNELISFLFVSELNENGTINNQIDFGTP